MRVVICGGGVIAACTAYFLARRGVEVIVVERTEVACAASGKAGGFLALDWCAGSALDALARRSFALHAQLVNEIDGAWAYQRMNAYSGYVVADNDARLRTPSRLDWLCEGVVISAQLGDSQTTAIVHPRKFTTALMQAAEDQGAQVRFGCVTGLLRDGTDAAVGGVEIDSEPLAADATVIAMGPWSILAAQWLPLPAVFGQQSPSLVYDTGTTVPADALFLEYREDSGAELTVEVFPRADGSTHVTAFSSQDPLPLDPAQIVPEPVAIERLQRICERLSPSFQSDRIIARQACFRPVTQDFLPLIGKVPWIDGAYIATGHNVWGILNAPATGEAMSELIADGIARSTDLRPFDPARLRAVDPARVRANMVR
jgi:glycine/D-amino acid oxidase-like deaminating enzyme